MPAESLFTKPIEEVTFRDVKRFCGQKIPEGWTVEYKADFPKELERIAASFANTAGGIILIGVKTDKANRPEQIVGVNFSRGLEERVLNICHSNTRPPITPEVAVCPLPLEEKGNISKCLLLVRVAESDEIIYVGEKRNYIYVRIGNISDRADETARRKLFKKIETGKKLARQLVERREPPKVEDFENPPFSFELPPYFTQQIIVVPACVTRELVKWTSEVDQFVRRSRPRHLHFGQMQIKQEGIEFRDRTNDTVGQDYFAEVTSEGLVLYREAFQKSERHECQISISHLIVVLKEIMDYSLRIYRHFAYSGRIVFRLRLDRVRDCRLADRHVLYTNYVSEQDSVIVERLVYVAQLESEPDQIIADIFLKFARAFEWSMNAKEARDRVKYYLSRS